jgi:hypothetical protein
LADPDPVITRSSGTPAAASIDWLCLVGGWPFALHVLTCIPTMRTVILLVLISLSLSLPATAAPPDTSLADRLDALMPELLDRYQIPGVAVALIRGDEVAMARGYGFADAEYRTPMTAQTVLNVASIAKPVAALGGDDARRGWPDRPRRARKPLPGPPAVDLRHV